MNALTVNAETGFLESSSPANHSFDSVKKQKFFELARECSDKDRMPRISKICQVLGIGTETFYHHLQVDAEFKRAWEEVLNQIEDVLSEALVENAKRANGVGAAAFWLKNRRADRWSDNPQANLQNNLDLGWLKKLSDAMQGVKPVVIDAEVVPKPGITSAQKPIDASQ